MRIEHSASVLAGISVFLHISVAPAVPAAIGADTVRFVDGTTARCEFLFEHPEAPRLVVRSADQATVQSFPVAIVQTIIVDGQRTEFNAARPLTEAEKQQRQRNGLWGNEVSPRQIGRYADETWETKPLYVWRYPGTNGVSTDPQNWLDESGSPLEALPWSEENKEDEARKGVAGVINGDVLLPGADREYAVVQPGNRDHLHAIQLRHLTVEANANYRIRYTVTGNLWVKDKAGLGRGTQTGGLGSGNANKHTFARFCNYHDKPEPTWAYAPAISHWVWIDTGNEGSLEVIGESGGAGDRLTLMRGTLVVGEDCFIGNGNRGAFFSQTGTKTILLDGARIGCPDPLMGGSGGHKVGTYGIAGTIMFGTPDRPLTRDLPFGACYYFRDRVTPQAVPGQRTHGASFVLGPTGRMVIHSADPQNARVIFQPRSKQLPVSQYMVPRNLWKHIDRRGKTYYPPKAELWEHLNDRDGVAAVFRGETDFNGVVFDGFYKGGIIVSPEQRKHWKNVEFGDNNHGTPEELFRDSQDDD